MLTLMMHNGTNPSLECVHFRACIMAVTNQPVKLDKQKLRALQPKIVQQGYNAKLPRRLGLVI